LSINDQKFTQKIIVEGLAAGSLSPDDFMLIGNSSQPTTQFDRLSVLLDFP
jgi:hypothetical protein